jgi:hypothetical protein
LRELEAIHGELNRSLDYVIIGGQTTALFHFVKTMRDDFTTNSLDRLMVTTTTHMDALL